MPLPRISAVSFRRDRHQFLAVGTHDQLFDLLSGEGMVIRENLLPGRNLSLISRWRATPQNCSGSPMPARRPEHCDYRIVSSFRYRSDRKMRVQNWLLPRSATMDATPAAPAPSPTTISMLACVRPAPLMARAVDRREHGLLPRARPPSTTTTEILRSDDSESRHP